MSQSKLIDKGQLSAFERWELPNMDPPEAEKATSRVEDVEETEVCPPMTAEQIEAIQQEAYKEGFEQGHRDGLKAGEAEIQTSVQRLAQIGRQLAQPLEELDKELAQELAELAIAIARQVLRREIETRPEEVVAVVREAIKLLPSSATRLRLFLHPEDANLVRQRLADGIDDERPWKIVEDAVLSRGGCRIESDRSRIDATVEKRIDAVVAQMLGIEGAIERGDEARQ